MYTPHTCLHFCQGMCMFTSASPPLAKQAEDARNRFGTRRIQPIARFQFFNGTGSSKLSLVNGERSNGTWTIRDVNASWEEIVKERNKGTYPWFRRVFQTNGRLTAVALKEYKFFNDFWRWKCGFLVLLLWNFHSTCSLVHHDSSEIILYNEDGRLMDHFFFQFYVKSIFWHTY